MLRVKNIDEEDKKCVVVYNRKEYTCWYDWHLGEVVVRDSKGKCLPVRTRFPGFEKYKTWKERYSSQEFKSGLLKEFERLSV